MRLAILAFPSPSGRLDFVLGSSTLSTKGHLERELRFRQDDGAALPGEHIVRLPRRLSKALAAKVWDAGYSMDSIDTRRTLLAGRPVFYGEGLVHDRGCNCSDCKSVLADPYLY